MSDWSEGMVPVDTSDTSGWDTSGGGGEDLSAYWAQLATDPVYQALGVQMGMQVAQFAMGGAPTATREAGTTGEDKGFIRSMLDGWKGLSTDDKKAGLTVATLLAGGLGNLSRGRREDRALRVSEDRLSVERDRLALEREAQAAKLANASAIGQTNFGTAMSPQPGLINAPVRLTRNRLMPTPGVSA